MSIPIYCANKQQFEAYKNCLAKTGPGDRVKIRKPDQIHLNNPEKLYPIIGKTRVSKTSEPVPIIAAKEKIEGFFWQPSLNGLNELPNMSRYMILYPGYKDYKWCYYAYYQDLQITQIWKARYG